MAIGLHPCQDVKQKAEPWIEISMHLPRRNVIYKVNLDSIECQAEQSPSNVRLAGLVRQKRSSIRIRLIRGLDS